jgi:hypothetical protein
MIQTVRDGFARASLSPQRRSRGRAIGQHHALNRHSDVYPHEDIQLDASTLADWVGACSATLTPLDRIRRHVLAADRMHGDDTTVPVLAKNKTVTGRLWTYLWTVHVSQGFSRRSGKSSVQQSSGLCSSLLQVPMRSADPCPSTLAGTKPDRAQVWPAPVQPVAITTSIAVAARSFSSQ